MYMAIMGTIFQVWLLLLSQWKRLRLSCTDVGRNKLGLWYVCLLAALMMVKKCDNEMVVAVMIKWCQDDDVRNRGQWKWDDDNDCDDDDDHHWLFSGGMMTMIVMIMITTTEFFSGGMMTMIVMMMMTTTDFFRRDSYPACPTWQA